jgi:hypothetical protein
MVVMTTRARTVVLVVALALAASLLTLAVVLAKPVQARQIRRPTSTGTPSPSARSSTAVPPQKKSLSKVLCTKYRTARQMQTAWSMSFSKPKSKGKAWALIVVTSTSTTT